MCSDENKKLTFPIFGKSADVVRDENIFLSELLKRDTEPIYSRAAKELVKDKVVLVTGAGGSIGSEIVRQLMTLEAKKIYCLDNNEYSLYELSLELYGNALLVKDDIILMDIRDKPLISRTFARIRPDIVFHAAALKHLPLLERAPIAAIQTNILGTDNVVSSCIEHGVKYFVNISTDKAAGPVSVLGMSKRFAELCTAGYKGEETKVASVRFGNVLGSRGSFLPTLAWQIENGKSVTMTHPDVSRFFMTIPEASSLVIEAAALATGGETYVLDMGESIRIADLIDAYVRVAGCERPRIVYTGLRKGEKLYEELFDPSEVHMPTAHPRISKARVDQSGGITPKDKQELRSMIRTEDAPENFKASLERLLGVIENRPGTDEGNA